LTVDDSEVSAVVPAGFWVRAAARVIDWVVVMAGFLIAFLNMCASTGFLSAFEHTTRQRTWIDFIDKESWVSWTTTLAAFVVYHAVAEGALGTTIGKRVMGLRVVTLELGRPSFRQAFQRSAGFLVDSFFFFLVAARAMNESPIRQRVGDEWADTRVVYQRTLGESSWPRGALFAGVMAGAMLAAGRVFAIGEYLSFLWLTKR
jgi:uncharacterized RDD family membrane protein YckC